MVLTPANAFWAFGVYALLLIVIAERARVPPATLFRRLTLEIPFVAFALALPFLAGGDRVDLLFISVSQDGLVAAWNVFVKATIGILAGILLASTTQPADLVHGLGRLHLPRVVVAIAGFMVRYADVVTGEMRRMRVARTSRSYTPRWLWQARATAWSAGTLFIRSYERGERVYLAMLSRGYTGTMPVLGDVRASPGRWIVCLVPALIATAVLACAWIFS